MITLPTFPPQEAETKLKSDRRGSQIFYNLLEEIADLHERKQSDYAVPGNPFSNFEYAAREADVTVEQSFRVLLGVKDARVLNLLGSERIPQNESVDETLKDRATYTLLWLAYRISQRR